MSYCHAEIDNKTLAILVNINDPESVEIASYYQQARNIPNSNVISLSFENNTESLTQAEFEKVEVQLKGWVSESIQAYALAWRKPWRVGCMSITSAFSLGFNKKYCAKGCKLTEPVEYFNSSSKEPYKNYGIRPSMMLTASSVQAVKELIDRGVSSDYVRPAGTAYLLSTSDQRRSVRATSFPHIKSSLDLLLDIDLVKADSINNKTDVLFYFTGLKKVKNIKQNKYLPGAVADHLTSTGGQLFGGSQMSVLKWIDAGVTGTYGTVVEPCNFVQKFSSPGVLMQRYLSGDTLLEAYWKSVKMPGQGVFVGEPLASPFKNCRMALNGFKQFRYIRDTPKNYVDKQSRNCN